MSAPGVRPARSGAAGQALDCRRRATDAIQRCRPLFEAMGQGVEIVGDDPPMANVLKLAGNFLLAAAIEAMGEAFAVVRKYGIEPSGSSRS